MQMEGLGVNQVYNTLGTRIKIMRVDDAVESMKQMNPQWNQYHDTVAS